MNGVDLRPSGPGPDPHAHVAAVQRGPAPGQAPVGLVLIHGRGDSAGGILGLVDALEDRGARAVTTIAPEAHGRVWYPESFLAPTERNEPWLSSALDSVDRAVGVLEAGGLARRRIVVAGFSQGACLASEYVARAGGRWGGAVVLSGGLIGADVDPARYPRRLDDTPVFFGCSDVDPHIPVGRVHASAKRLDAMGADVVTRIYPGMAHTVNVDEIDWFAQRLVDLAKEALGDIDPTGNA